MATAVMRDSRRAALQNRLGNADDFATFLARALRREFAAGPR
jgi:hypothetical protein